MTAEAGWRYAAARYAAATSWRTFTGGGYPMRPEDRPDPLAEPPRAPRRTGPVIDGDLTACSNTPCETPPSVILWVGCQRGEHAGPLPLCAHHATATGSARRHCGQCGGPMTVMKITSMDGVSTVWLPAPGPGEDIWREVTGTG